MDPTTTVKAFVEAINNHHIDKMIGLMTPDHHFTDSLGNQIPGRRAMRDAWLGYFDVVPDYRISVAETLADGSVVVIVGSAGGRCTAAGAEGSGTAFSICAAWRAVVDAGRIAEWRVYGDNGPLRDAIAAGGRS